ncbi:MAG: hypothetical protein U9R19_15820, partial [Bacteroidota bacterium]|nr:hypothetical protein [Bacteroidota bacterium]
VENYRNDSLLLLQNEFEFVQTGSSGFENQHIYVIKYEREYDIVRIDLLFKLLNKSIKVEVPLETEREVLKNRDRPEEPDNLRLYRKPE